MTLPKQVDLARQVEYYFTKQNLSTDTYLQRLRELNDGCVPVSILASFGRVRAMATSSIGNREKAIVDAISRHSTYLAVYAINTTTGKRQVEVVEEDQATGAKSIVPCPTILAVGLSVCDEHPPEYVGSVTESVDITDTIILRDVNPDVSEAEIRSLFESIEDCPSLVKICADVGHCW
jgi:La domain